MAVHKMNRAKPSRAIEKPRRSLHRKGHLHPALQRSDGESPGLHGIVAIPDQIEGRFGQLHPSPGLTVGEHTLVPRNHRLDHRLRHLRAQPKLCSQEPIDFPLQDSLLEAVRGVDDLRDRMASLAIGLDGLLE
ncbi:MAG: hypothetical protein M1499_07255 [Firmicutes bacterium]|nr:hypothetical protein [Bacillota bacterium]